MGPRIALIIVIFTLAGCGGLSFPVEGSSVHAYVFQYDGQAQSVCITGDFNQWASDTHCLRKHDGLWTIRLLLPSGAYRYAFIINGSYWVTDPKALHTENDNFGRRNSVTIID